jgi:general stress protein YciG
VSGTKSGGLKTKQTNIKNNPDFYIQIGQKGGRAEYKGKKGFAAATKEQLSEWGRKGGLASRRAK